LRTHRKRWGTARISVDATYVVEKDVERQPSSYQEVENSLPRREVMNSWKYRYQVQIDNRTAKTIEMIISTNTVSELSYAGN
jgi:cytidylate kinase